VVAQFGRDGANGPRKASRRPEKRFKLGLVPELRADGPQLGPVPTLLHRTSPDIEPLASATSPSVAADVQPGAPLFATDLSAAPLNPSRALWPVEKFREWSAGYPFPDVTELALATMGVGVDPFKGDTSKAVDIPDRLHAPADVALARAQLMKQVRLGFMIGPLSSPMFPAARICPFGMVPKDKYDPTSTKMRITSHFNATQPGVPESASVNDLCWRPDLLTFHVQSAHLNARIGFLFESFGPGTWGVGFDIPSCFRQYNLHPTLRPLATYRVRSEGVDEFWQDLRLPFGLRVSEWGHQTCVALFSWRLRQLGFAGLRRVDFFVDNTFLFGHPQAPSGASRTAAETALREAFAEMEVPLHEQQSGSVLSALGWEYHLDGLVMSEPGRPTMVCKDDKFAYVSTKLEQWGSPRLWPVFPLSELETASGVLTWLSAGFAQGRGHLAALVHDRTKYAAIAKRAKRPESRQVCQLSEASREALRFWAAFFPTWDKQRPVVLGFTPVSTAQVVGRVDASLTGCGGLFFVPGSDEVVLFMHEWSPAELEKALRSSDASQSNGSLERESTGVLEALGACMWASLFAARCRCRRVLLELDNEAVVLALGKAYSPRPEMLHPIRDFWASMSDVAASLRITHVVGALFNSVADHLSHGRFDEATCAAKSEFQVKSVSRLSSPARQ
jgi:hypothetical protein